MGFLAEAERIRACADAGAAPFGPALRQRLVELTGSGDPLLQSTWAGAVGPLLAGEVSTMVGGRWLERQRAGDGWLFCGGGDREVTAVVWVDGRGGETLLAAADPELAAYLMDIAPSLRRFPAPVLPPAAARS